jgi:hypothetical protein
VEGCAAARGSGYLRRVGLMNRRKLEETLQAMNVPSHAYSVWEDKNEAYCMIHDAKGFHVYYSERGNRNDEQIYADENAACRYFLLYLKSDSGLQESIRGKY